MTASNVTRTHRRFAVRCSLLPMTPKSLDALSLGLIPQALSAPNLVLADRTPAAFAGGVSPR